MFVISASIQLITPKSAGKFVELVPSVCQTVHALTAKSCDVWLQNLALRVRLGIVMYKLDDGGHRSRSKIKQELKVIN